jgi:hypothetical protein
LLFGGCCLPNLSHRGADRWKTAISVCGPRTLPPFIG